MATLTMEFPLSEDSVKLNADGSLSVDFGGGARMLTQVPPWVEKVNGARLNLVLSIEGAPPDADLGKPPIQ